MECCGPERGGAGGRPCWRRERRGPFKSLAIHRSPDTPRSSRLSGTKLRPHVPFLNLNFARKKKPELSTARLPHGTRGGELGRGPKNPSDRRRHQVTWHFNSRPHGRFAAVSEATKRDRTTGMTSAATAPGAASWKCTGPGRARGPLTLADAAERGIDEATNNEGRSFFACGCNRPKEISGSSWVPLAHREHTAQNGKWRLLDVR